MSDLFSVASKWGFSAIFRIVLPGLVLSLLLLPLMNPLVPPVLKIDELPDLATLLLPEVLVLGLFLSLLRGLVYRIYEGRLLWPQWLHRRLTERLHKKARKRLSEASELDRSSLGYKDLWYWLRMFPLDEKGDPIAVRPTTLGNILEGYEQYPLRRYGMDSIFYWYRLWPTLPDSFVKQWDQLGAEADCFMFVSFSGLCVGLLYVTVALVKWAAVWIVNNWLTTSSAALGNLDLIPSCGGSLIWGVSCLISGYIVYRISLPLHRRNGEFFKTTFDLYRDSIVRITEVSLDEREKWRQAWSYLQYMYIKCPHCERYYYAEEQKCIHCGKTQESGKQKEGQSPAGCWSALLHLSSLIGSCFRKGQ